MQSTAATQEPNVHVNTTSASSQQVQRRSCCGRFLFVFANRRAVRVALILFLSIVFFVLLSLLSPVVTFDPQDSTHGQALNASSKSSAVLAMVVFSITGAAFSLLWAMMHAITCCRRVGTRDSIVRIQCDGGRSCNCLHWETLSDLVFGVVVGVLAIVMLQQSPCKGSALDTAYGNWCPRYNVVVAFGLFSMVTYALILLLDMRVLCCGVPTYDEPDGQYTPSNVEPASNPGTASDIPSDKLSAWPPKEVPEPQPRPLSQSVASSTNNNNAVSSDALMQKQPMQFDQMPEPKKAVWPPSE